MNVKEFRLDVEALFSQLVFEHGHLHYGYFEDCGPQACSLRALAQAQVDYFEKMVEAIPVDVRTVLDVGSGTGSNAAGLVGRGYAVDCVCPSENLNTMARQKLPEESAIFNCRFEELVTNKRYDLLVFCESFHYLQAPIALRKAADLAEKYILIFDYYRKTDSDCDHRLSHRQLTQLMNVSFSNRLELIFDQDLTQHIVPTFLITDTITNTYLKPFVRTAIGRFRREHPVYSFLFAPILRKARYKAEKRSAHYLKFMKTCEYRMTLLAKTA